MCRKPHNMSETIGGDTGGSENLSTSLSNVARLAAHPKFVWVFNANYDGTIIYNNPVYYNTQRLHLLKRNASSFNNGFYYVLLVIN
jgi:hypothetical protein